MISGIRKWFVLRSYATKLGSDLRRRYGKHKTYTPAQVRRMAEKGGFNLTYLNYAYCMYCDRTSFIEHHRTIGENCDYDSMRTEIGDRFFGGDPSFHASDLIDHGSAGHHDSGGGNGDDVD